MMANITLHQFPYSHFNEKARWALAFKGIDYERVSYLPGPHMPSIRKLSGQTSTPVLCWDGETIAGSADIIEFLEAAAPEPRLFPDDANQQAEIRELIRWLDESVGPANRTVLFSALINEGGYMTGMFSNQRALPVQWFYRFTFPLAKGLIARGNGVNPDNVTRSLEITHKALERIASKIADTDYLVGDSFTAADLTAAALFAPLANPDHVDMKRPEPVPANVRAVIQQYAAHPTIAWVNRMYENHRP